MEGGILAQQSSQAARLPQTSLLFWVSQKPSEIQSGIQPISVYVVPLNIGIELVLDPSEEEVPATSQHSSNPAATNRPRGRLRNFMVLTGICNNGGTTCNATDVLGSLQLDQ